MASKPSSDLVSISLGLTLALTPLSAGASDPPKVVSVNLCTDQLVLLVADPSQIVSLTFLASDPMSSPLHEAASQYPQNRASAEEIVVQNPDIVVAGQYSDPVLIDLLTQSGIEVTRFPLTFSLDDIPRQIREMGALLEQLEKADRIAAAFEAERATYPPAKDDAPVAAFFYPNGYSLGQGTLSHDIITAAGARNLAVELGMTGGGRVSLEEIIVNQPDVLIGAPRYEGFSKSEEVTRHPSIAHIPVVESSTDWSCGTPYALRAVAEVADALARLPETGHSE